MRPGFGKVDVGMCSELIHDEIAVSLEHHEGLGSIPIAEVVGSLDRAHVSTGRTP